VLAASARLTGLIKLVNRFTEKGGKGGPLGISQAGRHILLLV